MKLHPLFILPFFIGFGSIGIAQNTEVHTANEHSHCAFKCGIEKEPAGPLVHSNTYSKQKRYKKNNLVHYIGSSHQHSGFSDGFPGTTPNDYFDRGRENGFDFVLGADHSDFYEIPLTLHENCASADILDCIAIDFTDPIGSIFKWPKFDRIVNDKTEDGDFVAVRGFEWTSDRFGHINVYFSQNITNAKTDGGYVFLSTFWNWLSTEPNFIPGLSSILGGYGGADAVAVFNHPGDKSLFDTDPGFNWNGFEYVADVDSIMVGIEVFNRGRDFAANGRAFYQEALDAGWHVGAIGSEDHHENDWSNMSTAKTVMMTEELSNEGIKSAMKKRRTYATKDFGLRMNFMADDALMGSRIQRVTGSTITLSGDVESDLNYVIQLVSNDNEILAQFSRDIFSVDVPVFEEERWYYIRVVDPSDDRSIAYSSPIWIRGGADGQPVSVSEQEKMEIELYPNPVRAGEKLSFNNLNNNLSEARVRSLDGRIVLQKTLSATNANNLDLPKNLVPGIYLLELEQKNNNVPLVQKFILN